MDIHLQPVSRVVSRGGQRRLFSSSVSTVGGVGHVVRQREMPGEIADTKAAALLYLLMLIARHNAATASRR